MTALPRPPMTARLSEGNRLGLACGVAAAYGVVLWWALDPNPGGLPATVTAIALTTLSLAVARRLPLVAVALAIGGLCLSPLSADLAFAALAPVSYALFHVAARRSPRVALPALVCGVIGSGGVGEASTSIAYDDDGLTISVSDAGRGGADAPRLEGTGHGLLGMQERVATFGGCLQAGPLPGHGFCVSARLPTPARLPSSARLSTAEVAA